MAGGDPLVCGWRKSSYSLGNGDCVEVAHSGDVVAVRNSKHPEAGMLTFGIDQWLEFLSEVKRGDWDREPPPKL